MGDPPSSLSSSSNTALISGLFTTNGIVIIIGLIVLTFIAVLVGTSMDTEAQRRSAQAAADERRELNAARQQLADERRRLDAARLKLAEQSRAFAKQLALRRRCQKCAAWIIDALRDI